MFTFDFDHANEIVVLQPLEFVNFGNNVVAFSQLANDINIVAQSKDFLSQFYGCLVARNLTGTFGITLDHRKYLHSPQTRSRGTTETSDVETRKLTIRRTVDVEKATDMVKKVPTADKCVGHIITCTGGCNRDNEQISANVAWSTSDADRWSTSDADRCVHSCFHPNEACHHGSWCVEHRICYHNNVEASPLDSTKTSSATVAWSEAGQDECSGHIQTCEDHNRTGDRYVH